MERRGIIPVLLSLAFILSACGSYTTPPAEESSSDVSSSASSSAASSVLPSVQASSASSVLPSSSAGSVSSSLAASSAVFSAAASSSKADRPGSAAVPAKAPSAAPSKNVTSSIPLSPIPKPAAKPMPAVTAKIPEASGGSVFSQQGCTLDYSNASDGYIMVKYSGSVKVKVLVYFGSESSYYQYDISSGYATLPLQKGSGTYRVRFMENVSGNSYAELSSTQVNASISGYGYTLYPNQYVNYTRSTTAVTTAKSLCASATSNAEKVDAIYKYITKNIKYDYSKASSVKPGYVPSVDATLSSKKGICFDYAALMAAMCRSQNIPTRLVIGDASVGYHSWNDIYVNGSWKRYDSTMGAAGQTATGYTPQKYY